MKRRHALTALGTLPFAIRQPAIAQQLTTLRVVGSPNDGFKQVYYGVRSGTFRKYGLDVQTTLMSSGAAGVAALAGGAADAAYTNVVGMITAFVKAVPMKIVAPMVWYLSEKPSTLMLVLKDSPIRSGRDLIGKVVGAPSLGDIISVGMFAWIDQTGGDSKSVRAIEVPASAGLAVLEQGRADAVSIIEPAASEALATGRARILSRPLDAIAKRFEGGCMIAMDAFIEKNTDAMARFARAMHDASVYTNAHLAETVELVSSYSGIAPDVVAKSVRLTDPEYAEPRYIQPVIDALVKYGRIDRSFRAEDMISTVALKPPR